MPNFLGFHSLQELQRKIHPHEAMNAHLLPTNRRQCDLSGGVKLELNKAKVSNTALTKMAGNSMNLPCVGSVILTAVLCLSPKA